MIYCKSGRRPSGRLTRKVAILGLAMALPGGVGVSARVDIDSHSAAMDFEVATPEIPIREFPAADFGAVGDGKTRNTGALQRAIDACGAVGGGKITIPAGRYLTGPLTFVSRMELHLDAGATLLLSDDRHDFPLTANRYQDAFSARNCHDIAITGSGAIDGQGADWWAHFSKSDKTSPHRPFLLMFTNCQRISIRGITLSNSPMFHLVPQRCQDVTIDGIHIQSPANAPNTDGIDPSGWRFHISNCTIDTGDDDIAVKPSGRISEDLPACRDFLIDNCTFLHGHGMSIGGQTPGGLENLTVRNCTFTGTDAGIRLKAPRGQGGLVQNLLYENLTMRDVKTPLQITSFYNGNSPTQTTIDPATDPAQPVTATTPIWRNIRIRDVKATGAKTAGQIFGLAEMPVSDVRLTNVHISADKSLEIAHAKMIRFERSQIVVKSGEPLILTDADVTSL